MAVSSYRLAYCDEYRRISGSLSHPPVERVKGRAYDAHNYGRKRRPRKVYLAKKRIPLFRYVRGVIAGKEALWPDHLGLLVDHTRYFQLEKSNKSLTVSMNFFEMRDWSDEFDQENELELCGTTIMTDEKIFYIGTHLVHCWLLRYYHPIWNNCQNAAFDVLENILDRPTYPYHTEGIAYLLSKLRTWVVRPVVREFLEYFECPSAVIEEYEERVLQWFLLCNNSWRISGMPLEHDRLKMKLETTSKPLSTIVKAWGNQVVSDMHLGHAFIDFLPYIQRFRSRDAEVVNLRDAHQPLSNQTKLLMVGPAMVTGMVKNVVSMIFLLIRHKDTLSASWSRRAQRTFQERHGVTSSVPDHLLKKVSDARTFFKLFWDGFGTWEQCYAHVQEQRQDQQHNARIQDHRKDYSPTYFVPNTTDQHRRELQYLEHVQTVDYDIYHTFTKSTRFGYDPRSEKRYEPAYKEKIPFRSQLYYPRRPKQIRLPRKWVISYQGAFSETPAALSARVSFQG